MMANPVVMTLLGVAICGFSAGNALKCVVCKAPCPTTLEEPKLCINGEEFCMKQLIGVPGDETYQRDCTLTAPPEGQTKVCKGVGSKEDCIYYCKTDGCNAAPAFHHPRGQWITLTGSILSIIVLNNSF